MGRIKDKNLYPIKPIPVIGDTIIGSDSQNAGKTVQFNVGSGAADFDLQNNRIKIIDLPLVSTTDDDLTPVAIVLNLLSPNQEVLADEIPLLKITMRDIPTDDVFSYVIGIINNGKGIYGAGGNLIIPKSQLIILQKTVVSTTLDPNNDPNALVIDLGDIGAGGDFIQLLNDGVDSYVVDETVNLYVEFTRGVNRELWGFKGVDGEYGGSATDFNIADFFLIFDEAEPPSDDQNASEVPIAPIVGVTGNNVQEALEFIYAAIPSAQSTLYAADGQITENRTVTFDVNGTLTIGDPLGHMFYTDNTFTSIGDGNGNDEIFVQTGGGVTISAQSGLVVSLASSPNSGDVLGDTDGLGTVGWVQPPNVYSTDGVIPAGINRGIELTATSSFAVQAPSKLGNFFTVLGDGSLSEIRSNNTSVAATATDVRIELGNPPSIGQALVAKDTSGNVEWADVALDDPLDPRIFGGDMVRWLCTGAFTQIGQSANPTFTGTVSNINPEYDSIVPDKRYPTTQVVALKTVGICDATFETLTMNHKFYWSGEFLLNLLPQNNAFCGLHEGVGLAPDVGASTLLNCVGVGMDDGDANLSFIHNDGAGTGTKIDLGANFATIGIGTVRLSLSVEMYHDGTNLYYRVNNLDLGTDNPWSAPITTNLPVASAALSNKLQITEGSRTSGNNILKLVNLAVYFRH